MYAKLLILAKNIKHIKPLCIYQLHYRNGKCRLLHRAIYKKRRNDGCVAFYELPYKNAILETNLEISASVQRDGAVKFVGREVFLSPHIAHNLCGLLGGNEGLHIHLLVLVAVLCAQLQAYKGQQCYNKYFFHLKIDARLYLLILHLSNSPNLIKEKPGQNSIFTRTP